MRGLATGSYKEMVGTIDTILVTLGSTGMAVGAFIALLLDNTIPGTPEERGLQHMKSSP